MDPVSGLALACNILDMIERGYKCAATIKKLHDSQTGLLKQHEMLVGETDTLSDIAGEIDTLSDIAGARQTDERNRQEMPVYLRCHPNPRQQVRDMTRLSESQILEVSDTLRVLSSSLNKAAQSNDSGQSSSVLEKLQELLCAATEATEASKISQVLDELYFPTMKERFSNVGEIAPRTFDWIFKDSGTFLDKQPGSKITFRDWLRSGTGIFHIEGKPGSGKSTLMKHICDHHETENFLREWAGEKRLITWRFFFWRPGTPEQKSLRGLTRGLLWGIIRRERQLAKLLFPRLWRPTEFPESPPSQFIDLSDEDVDKALGLLHLQQWASSPCRNVKLCVSSRQLPVFSHAFSPAQRLTIHLFTHEDIVALVDERLEQNGAFRELAKSEKYRCGQMVAQVISRAEGVFLWVCIVLNRLEDSLRNGDSITMLESIVKTAPTELDDLFSYILTSIPLHYRRQAFIMLALAMRLDDFLLSEELRDSDSRAGKPEYENSGWRLSLFSCSYLLEGLDDKSKSLEKVFNDEIATCTLAWMTLIDLSYREKKKLYGHANKEPYLIFDSQGDKYDPEKKDLCAPTVLINKRLHPGAQLDFYLPMLLFQIGRVPATDPELIMPLLQQIEQELLYHQFGIRTFNEIPEYQRHYYDMVSLYSSACVGGHNELICWDHENKSLSLTRGQDWMIANLLGSVIHRLPFYRGGTTVEFYLHRDTTIVEYFFRAGVSAATQVDLNPHDLPRIGSPALRSELGVKPLLPKPSHRSPEDSILLEGTAHRATLRDLFVVSLLIKPRYKFTERFHLCLYPFPPVFGEMLQIFMKYGATFSITMSLDDLYRRKEFDPDRDIELLPSDSESYDDDDDDEGNGNTWLMTGRPKYQIMRRIGLTRDGNWRKLITFDGVIELLISSGGSITLGEFLRFIGGPCLDVPVSPVDDAQPDGGLAAAPSSSPDESFAAAPLDVERKQQPQQQRRQQQQQQQQTKETLEKAETSGNEDLGSQATKQPGLFPWVTLETLSPRDPAPDVGCRDEK
ncbi:uncharacterized protein C8A04DRAFT_40145 [Dichotomopilus funicola]|uniref:Nephrocystin 3-like N-terminal domain-containing protein n=1 Tax=Dichotomopilus funicola TaxID=1934379 RepID=A0AAN6UYC2_9PEZI|nr:hypothetical protein C8A04DRAFT_40145 [Dichotomopilus funicola]